MTNGPLKTICLLQLNGKFEVLVVNFGILVGVTVMPVYLSLGHYFTGVVVTKLSELRNDILFIIWDF